MKEPVELVVVIATYNELPSLPALVESVWQRLPSAHILVVDDNSPDGTGDWVRKTAINESRIELLHRDQKQGLGVAAIAGIDHALKDEPTWIATMDADFSHHPDDLEAMWNVARSTSPSCDVVIGSRYVSGGRIENWSWRRRIASKAVNWFARWVLWLGPRDNSGAFRIYRTDTLRRLDFARIDCPGFAYLEQILVHLQRSGASFREVPIVFRERKLGESKVTFGELSRNLRDILALALKPRR